MGCLLCFAEYRDRVPDEGARCCAQKVPILLSSIRKVENRTLVMESLSMIHRRRDRQQKEERNGSGRETCLCEGACGP
jgi:hypothetical protein